MINSKQPRFHTFLLGFNVSIKSTKIPLSSFGQKIYITRININCRYTHNHISRKVPLFTRCICDLSHGRWRVLQMIYFVCKQGNLKLQLQHLSVHVIGMRSLRRTGIFWHRRNSAWRLDRTASCGGGEGKWAAYLRPYPNPYLKRLHSFYSRLVDDECPDGFSWQEC